MTWPQRSNKNSPVWHWLPVHPGLHLQVQVLIPSTQSPFMQGFDAHSSISEHEPHKDIFWCARGEVTKTRVGINKEIGAEYGVGERVYDLKTERKRERERGRERERNTISWSRGPSVLHWLGKACLANAQIQKTDLDEVVQVRSILFPVSAILTWFAVGSSPPRRTHALVSVDLILAVSVSTRSGKAFVDIWKNSNVGKRTKLYRRLWSDVFISIHSQWIIVIRWCSVVLEVSGIWRGIYFSQWVTARWLKFLDGNSPLAST